MAAGGAQSHDCKEVVPPVPAYPDALLAPHDLQQATALYNGMIHPLEPFALRGAICIRRIQHG